MNEPISVYTNLAYLAAGVAVGFMSYDIYLSVSLGLLAFSSFMFHLLETRNNFWHRADEFMIYVTLHAVAVVVLGYDLIVIVFGGVVLLYAGFNLGRPEVNTFKIVPGASVVIVLGLGFLHGWNGAIVVLLVGLLAGFLRAYLQPNFPEHADFIHGFWHIVSAAALYLAWVMTQQPEHTMRLLYLT